MGMETLNNAARAAGFAMAASDELEERCKPEPQPEPQAPAWSAGDPLLSHSPKVMKQASSSGDWMRSVFSVFSRRGATA